jgi:hypothetical protein
VGESSYAEGAASHSDDVSGRWREPITDEVP